ncbi:MAG: TonB-dependent receptor [Pedobacter sp.]|nr:MAG: TonB-dependent receptor [Pedobacter sp.]
MKFRYLIIILLFVVGYNSGAHAITTATSEEMKEIKGKVIDKETNHPLPGATVFISDLKLSTQSNYQGEFILKNLPSKGKFLVEVKYIGFKATSQLIDLNQVESLVFEMETAIIESAEVVITGTPFSGKSKHSSLAVVTTSREKLMQTGANNLIEALGKLPGVNQVSTGAAIAKPSIRGLGFNRVLTMVDGVREEAQQWGEEHGVQVDQFSAARVEILKGPASLLYGSDALGGVINIIDDFIPALGTHSGSFNTSYGSNNGLSSSSLMYQGNQNGLVYRARASYKNAHAFKSPGAYVPNSGFKETNVSGLVGLNKSWGYSHFTFSRANSNIGLIEEGPEEDGSFHGHDGHSMKERSLENPYQYITHYRAALNSNILLGHGQLKSTFGFQRNLRSEFENHGHEDHDHETENEHGGHHGEENLGIRMQLNSFTYDVKYAIGNLNGWEPTFGIQGMYQTNQNTGLEYLIPDYSSFNIGFFGYLKRNFENGSWNVGARYDFKNLNSKVLMDGNEVRFEAFDNKFSNFSGSAGFTYDLSKNIVFRANAGSGFRAPNIAELGSNGTHHGTFRYEIGDPNLKPEISYQVDLGLDYSSEFISLGVNAFNNRINNFIHAVRFNNEVIEEDHVDHAHEIPVFRFVQANANLIGGEANLDFHIIKDLHLENSFSIVKGTNRASKDPLPFIPATNLQHEIVYEPHLKNLVNTYIKFSYNHVFKQNRFASFETETPSYGLIDAAIGTAIPINKGKINVWLSAQNLGNVKYINHLSRFKPIGIFNPGRNFNLGINIPL